MQTLVDSPILELDASSIQGLTETLGERGFGSAMLAAIQAHVETQQLTLFGLDETSGFESLLNAGTMIAPETATRLSDLYCRKYFEHDPLFNCLIRYGRKGEAHAELYNSESFCSRQADPWRRYLNFGDRCSLVFGRNAWTYCLSLYRAKGLPCFSDIECRRIEQFAPIISGLVYAHHVLLQERDDQAWPDASPKQYLGRESAGQLLFSLQLLLASP